MSTTTAIPMYSEFFTYRDFLFMLRGAGVTLALTLISGVAGTALGFLIGWGRSFDSLVVRYLLGAYIDVIRSVPLLLQFVWFISFIAILGFPLSAFVAGAITLTLYIGGYVAEVVTGGIEAVPVTTRRAARSLGMTYLQDFFHIVVPIGTKAVFPAWIGLMLGLMKDTSLIAVIGAVPPELIQASRILINRILEPLYILLGAAVFYFIMCYALSWTGSRLEARWSRQQEASR